MSLARNIIFGFISAILIFLGIMAFQCSRQQFYAHDHYRPVDAVITTSKLGYTTDNPNSGSSGVHSEIGYNYVVNGIDYKAWRYAYASSAVSPSQMIERYPLGRHVTAYYDPANPAEAILNNAVMPIWKIVLSFLPWPFIIGGFWWLYERSARRSSESKKNGANL